MTVNPFAEPYATRRFLEASLQGPVSNLQPFARGLHCRIFSFEFQNQQLVLRLAHDGSHVLKEWQAHHYLGSALPIPGVFKEGAHAQQYWAIVARCPGQALAQKPFRLAQPVDHNVLIDSLLKLHTHPVLCQFRGFGSLGWESGQGLVSWHKHLISVFGQSAETLASDSLLSPECFNDYYQRLIQLLPYCPQEAWVLHGDFKAQNIIVNQGQITGIVDWSGLGFGDFLYDVAVYSFYLPASERQLFLQQALTRYQQAGFDLTVCHQRLAAYTLHSALGALMTLGQRHAQFEFAQVQQELTQLLDADHCFPVALDLS